MESWSLDLASLNHLDLQGLIWKMGFGNSSLKRKRVLFACLYKAATTNVACSLASLLWIWASPDAIWLAATQFFLGVYAVGRDPTEQVWVSFSEPCQASFLAGSEKQLKAREGWVLHKDAGSGHTRPRLNSQVCCRLLGYTPQAF